MAFARTLDEVHADIWRKLTAAPDMADHAWRLPVLGTVADGQPQTRTVVLRAVNASDRTLTIHTDIRSPKVAQLRTNPSVSLVLYDQASMEQVVACGAATIHTNDDVADANWETAAASSRRGYLGKLAPGTRVDQPETNLPETVAGRIPSEEELTAGRSNFAAITIAVATLDWLLLDRSGNYRAVFRYEPDGAASSDWLAP